MHASSRICLSDSPLSISCRSFERSKMRTLVSLPHFGSSVIKRSGLEPNCSFVTPSRLAADSIGGGHRTGAATGSVHGVVVASAPSARESIIITPASLTHATLQRELALAIAKAGREMYHAGRIGG